MEKTMETTSSGLGLLGCRGLGFRVSELQQWDPKP